MPMWAGLYGLMVSSPGRFGTANMECDNEACRVEIEIINIDLVE
jgi:hypothetical protein